MTENENIVEAINNFKPDVKFIGMTAPKQEKWAFENYEKLDAGHICSIGASIFMPIVIEVVNFY